MYIIMYKYSAFKINSKSFPNNIKNPIAPAQRKQSPPSPSSPTRPGISQQQTPCCHKNNMGSLIYRAGKDIQLILLYKLLICFTLVALAILSGGVI